MPLLSDQDRDFLKGHFAESLAKPVTLLFFTQEHACEHCQQTESILRELAELSEKIDLDVHDFVEDRQLAEEHGVDKIPATVIVSDVDYGVRFFGIPSGYEFTSLIEDIVDVSTGEVDLSDDTLETLASIQEPVHIQVFVTPTCPYCPMAVRLAHKLAIASDQVEADMVEAIEFPQLAVRYSVQGVPRSIINEDTHLEGAAPEPLFMAKLQQALGKLSQKEFEALLTEMESGQST